MADRSRGVIRLTNEFYLPREGDIPFIQLGSHYSRAPIVEAIIELRCELPDSIQLTTLTGAVNADAFPEVGRHVEVTGTLDVSDAELRSGTSVQQTGFVFKRKDGLRIIQARLNGFSYSALAPYDKWESFHDEALRHWEVYRNRVQPTKVTRLGVRYVNRIDIPSARVEIKDYLRTAIDVSPYLPQIVASHFFQVEVPLSRYGAVATITSTFAPPSREDVTSLVLDIDAWRPTDIDLTSDGALSAIRNALDSLRQAKNYTFEACITDATRGLIV
jgi:uncharacterized protein (TIGR04255 family)